MPSTPPDDQETFAAITHEILAFRDAREWAQFHTPRNLAAAVAIEVSELQETMLWKTDAEVQSDLKDPTRRVRMRHEVADVLIYALLFAHAIGADPVEAIREKLASNNAKYPVDKARGSALKYTELPRATDAQT
jgi:NTP pyrophosphatase (non-canonical NTP hydrolase)